MVRDFHFTAQNAAIAFARRAFGSIRRLEELSMMQKKLQ
jgi:hypothetical protein